MIEATLYFVHVNRLFDHRVLTYTQYIMLNYYYKSGSVLPWMESYGLFKVQSHLEYNLAGLQITLEFYAYGWYIIKATRDGVHMGWGSIHVWLLPWYLHHNELYS